MPGQKQPIIHVNWGPDAGQVGIDILHVFILGAVALRLRPSPPVFLLELVHVKEMVVYGNSAATV